MADFLNPGKALTKSEHERLSSRLNHPVTWPRHIKGYSTETYRRNELQDWRQS